MNKFLCLVALAVLASCGGSPTPEPSVEDQAAITEMRDNIGHLRAQAFEQDVRMDRAVGHDLMKAYIAFANQHPQDSLTAEYLFQAASVGQALGKHRKSIELLCNVHDGYPEFDKRVESLFLVAFTYQRDMNDRIAAEKYYDQVIELYPESIWAEQAQASLVTLNLTDDQLLDFLEEKNAGADTP